MTESFTRSSVDGTVSWHCPHCGKENPGALSRCRFCWQDVETMSSLATASRPEPLQRWEYLLVDTSTDDWNTKDTHGNDGGRANINSLGNQGWELTGTLPGAYGFGTLFFKRPKHEPRSQ